MLYQPLFNLLIWLYQVVPGKDFGVAIILLTILVRLLLYPLTVRVINSQKRLAGAQIKIQEIRRKFKQDKERQLKEIVAFYQGEKINPFSGLLPFIIQAVVLVAIFQVFNRGFGPEQMVYLYNFISAPEEINLISFGVINLRERSLVIALLTSVAQFFQSKMLIPKIKKNKEKDDQIAQISAITQKQMLYFIPIFTIFFLSRLPSAVGLSWLVAALFSIGQQRLILKNQNAKP